MRYPLNLLPHVPAEDYLELLELYLTHQSIDRVSQAASLSKATTVKRLRNLGIELRPPYRSRVRVQDLNPAPKLEAIRAQLQGRIGQPVAPKRPGLTPADRLRTLDLYLEHQNTYVVAEVLGICGKSVRQRLRTMGVTLRPSGHSRVRVEDVNDPQLLGRLRRQLQSQVAQEQAAAKR